MIAIPPPVMAHALAALACQPSKILIVADMSLPMSDKRMWVFDTTDPKHPVLVQQDQVEHGYGSDPGKTGTATKFSNTQDSGMTSLGLYTVGDPYIGKLGRSYYLSGLTPGKNTNADQRDIRLHPVHHPISWSAGCLAVEAPVLPSLEKKLGVLTGATIWVDGPGIKTPVCQCTVPKYWKAMTSWPATA
jgi:hypothetical protein